MAATGEVVSLLGIGAEDLLEFTSKRMKQKAEAHMKEIITIALIDKNLHSKKLLCNEFTTPEDLVDFIAEKIGLARKELFDFTVLDPDGKERWLERKRPIFDKRSVLPEDRRLTLRMKYVVDDPRLLYDRVATHLCYLQTKLFVLNGRYPASEEQSMLLASYQFQATFGDYNPDKHKPGFLDAVVAQWLPPNIQKALPFNWQEKIFDLHKTYRGIRGEDMEKRYIMTASKLPRYGLQIFDVMDRARTFAMFAGISSRGLTLFDREMDQLVHYDFLELTGWKVQSHLMIVSSLLPGKERILWFPSHYDCQFAEELLTGYKEMFHAESGRAPARSSAASLAINTLSTNHEITQKVILPVMLPDMSFKKLPIVLHKDTPEALVAMLADKLGLADTQYFSVADITQGWDRWLNPLRPLSEQGIRESSKIILKQKYLFSRLPKPPIEPAWLHLVYLQAKQNVLDDHNPCTLEQAVALAAWSLQASFGDYDKKKHKSGFLDSSVASYFPKRLFDAKSAGALIKKVLAKWKDPQLKGVSNADAELGYLHKAMELPFYSFTCFTITVSDALLAVIKRSMQKEFFGKLLFGIAEDGIAFLSPDEMVVLVRFQFKKELVSWSISPEQVTMKVKSDGNEDTISFLVSPYQSKTIKELFTGYYLMLGASG